MKDDDPKLEEFWKKYDIKRKPKTKTAFVLKKVSEIKQTDFALAVSLINKLLSDFANNSTYVAGLYKELGDLYKFHGDTELAIQFYFKSADVKLLEKESEKSVDTSFPVTIYLFTQKLLFKLCSVVFTTKSSQYYDELQKLVLQFNLPDVCMWVAYELGDIKKATKFANKSLQEIIDNHFQNTRTSNNGIVPSYIHLNTPQPYARPDWIKHSLTGKTGKAFLYGLLDKDSKITPKEVSLFLESKTKHEDTIFSKDNSSIYIEFPDYAFHFYWLSAESEIKRGEFLYRSFSSRNKKKANEISIPPSETSLFFCMQWIGLKHNVRDLENYSNETFYDACNDAIDIWANIDSQDETVWLA